MLDSLQVYNFHPQAKLDSDTDKIFVIRTCQRILAINYGTQNSNPFQNQNYNHFCGQQAYEFLLEIVCGLQSKLIGENEIVGQFKLAYKEYCLKKDKETKLILILEKLFKDSKEIRSSYLLGLCQKTYASIARKQIINVNKAQEVLILGSGSLAEDLINQFKKKATVYISARNSEKVNQLANAHDIKIVPWKNTHLFQEFPFIVNTIGFNGILLDESFFINWDINHDKSLLVDLGSPSAIESPKNLDNKIMTLENVFDEGAVHENHKKNQIKKARFAIAQIVEKRYIHLKEKKLWRLENGESSEHRQAI